MFKNNIVKVLFLCFILFMGTYTMSYAKEIPIFSADEFNNAIKNCENGDVLKLSNDINITYSDERIRIPNLKSIIIELNNYNITALNFFSPITVETGAELEIRGNGKIYCESAEERPCYCIINNGKLIINGNAIFDSEYAITTSGLNSTVIINEGLFNGQIMTSGHSSNQALTINGGQFNNSLLLDGYCTVDIKGGSFTLDKKSLEKHSSIIEINSGILNISGGTFNANIDTSSNEKNTTSSNYKHKGLIVVNNKDYIVVNVNIYGGTFTNEHKNSDAIVMANSNAINSGYISTINITGNDISVTGSITYYAIASSENNNNIKLVGKVSEENNIQIVNLKKDLEHKIINNDIQGEKSIITNTKNYKYCEIVVKAGENGKINPKGVVKVTKGMNQTFNIEADDGYYISKLIVDNANIALKSIKSSVEEYTFENVNENHVIEIEFKEKPYFDDVPEYSMYFDAVNFVFDNNLMQGTSDGIFETELPVTRGMMATILYRLSKENTIETSTFADVPIDSYYTNAIVWASKQGIVTGVGNNLFEPDRSINNEEFATMIYRYYIMENQLDENFSINFAYIYIDQDEISEYAYGPAIFIKWQNLMEEENQNYFAPKSLTTRGNVAITLMRYVNNLQKK